MTKREAQKHAEALGFPFIAMDPDTWWLMYRRKPKLGNQTWEFDDSNLPCPIYAKIEYTGSWKESLVGPQGEIE